MITKACLECGQNVNGRSDKKFCDDGCRNLYNNRLNSYATNFIRNVNNALRKNRRILQDLYRSNVKHIYWQRLAVEGFNFSLYTHSNKTKPGNTWFYCYEFGYMFSGSGRISIASKERNLISLQNDFDYENRW